MKFPHWPLLLRWSWRIAAAWLVFVWITRAVLPAFALTDMRRDAILYYRAARAADAGAPLYTPRPNYGPDSKPFEYLYPPPFAAAIAPLGRVSWPTFILIWRVGLLLSFAGYALCLCALCGRRDAWTFLAWLAILHLWPGTFRALALGQIDPVLWLLGGLSVWGARAATPSAGWARAACGAALGASSLVKIYGVWPLLALGKSEGRARAWAAAALVMVAGLAWGVGRCGLDSYAQWAHAVLPVAGQGTFNPDNYSFSMGVLRIARALGWNYAGGPLVGPPKMWLSFAAIAGPLGALLASRRLEVRWRVALVSCAAAWCAPLCWSTYLPLALLLVALAWKNITGQSHEPFPSVRFASKRDWSPGAAEAVPLPIGCEGESPIGRGTASAAPGDQSR